MYRKLVLSPNRRTVNGFIRYIRNQVIRFFHAFLLNFIALRLTIFSQFEFRLFTIISIGDELTN